MRQKSRAATNRVNRAVGCFRPSACRKGLQRNERVSRASSFPRHRAASFSGSGVLLILSRFQLLLLPPRLLSYTVKAVRQKGVLQDDVESKGQLDET